MNSSREKERCLQLFHKVYRSSPAYKHFVDSYNVNVRQIRSIADFDKIPIMDKSNYITKYPVHKRLYIGKQMSDFYMLCSSSGSTGKPTFWPRDIKIDELLESKKEDLYNLHFNISGKKTLCVVTFGLGVWTAGMLTTKLSWGAAKGNKMTVVTPGMDKFNAVNIIRELYSYYDQVIVLGYPPFLADIVDEARKKKFNLRKANTKFMCTSERFSELWRSKMVKSISKTGSKYDVVGFYACSDTGIIGFETKETIDILEQTYKDGELSNALFGTYDSPTLVQYDSSAKYVEEVDGEIIITADQAVPLIRYNIHDRGGLLTGSKISKVLSKYGFEVNVQSLAHDYLYIFGRADAVKLTANVYIDDVKYCLEHSSYRDYLSMHFKFGTEYYYGRKRLKLIIYLNDGKILSKAQACKFEKEFYNNLLVANNDFKMIQSGTKIEKFKYIYRNDPKDKYSSSKLKYFINE